MASILIVDDEPSILNFLRRVLERAGYFVQAAENGRAALEVLERQPVDLLLTDIKMDYLDGVGLMQAALARYPDLAVVLLTGHATVDSAVAALRHGAVDYLLKPASNEDILQAVADGLAHRTREQRRDQLEQVAMQMSALVQRRADVHPTPTLTVGALYLDEGAFRAVLGEDELDLTPTEFRLLTALVRQPGQALDYVDLVEQACGYRCLRHEAQEIIGTHVRNLRRKMGVGADEAYYVESVRGVGYRLAPPD